MKKLNILRILATLVIIYSAVVSLAEDCPEAVSCGVAGVCQYPLSFCCTDIGTGTLAFIIFMFLLWIAPLLDMRYREQYNKAFPIQKVC